MTLEQAIITLHRERPGMPLDKIMGVVFATRPNFTASELRVWRRFRELMPPRRIPCDCGGCAVCWLKLDRAQRPR